VAKIRLADLEKNERQRVEVQGVVANGNMRFGDALAIFRGWLHNDGALKPRSKAFREERIAALLNSWPELEDCEVCLPRCARYKLDSGKWICWNQIRSWNRPSALSCRRSMRKQTRKGSLYV